MTLQYVDSKHKLPTDSDFECSICYDNINLDEVLYGVPNCVICINGHRIHNKCFRQIYKHKCPLCMSSDMRFGKSRLGYSYVERNKII